MCMVKQCYVQRIRHSYLYPTWLVVWFAWHDNLCDSVSVHVSVPVTLSKMQQENSYAGYQTNRGIKP